MKIVGTVLCVLALLSGAAYAGRHMAFVKGTGCFSEADEAALNGVYGIPTEKVAEFEAEIAGVLRQLQDNIDQPDCYANAGAAMMQVFADTGLAPAGLQPFDTSAIASVEQFCGAVRSYLTSVAKKPTEFLAERGVSTASELLEQAAEARFRAKTSPNADPMQRLLSANKDRAARMRASEVSAAPGRIKPARKGSGESEYFNRKIKGGRKGLFKEVGVFSAPFHERVESLDFGDDAGVLAGESFDTSEIRNRGEGVFSWRGKGRRGQGRGWSNIVRVGDSVQGSIVNDEGVKFLVEGTGVDANGDVILAITQIDQTAFGADEPPERAAVALLEEEEHQRASRHTPQELLEMQAREKTGDQTPGVIWVAIGYTSTAFAKAGNNANNMNAFLNQMIDESNLGLTNSGVAFQYQLCLSYQTTDVSTTTGTDAALISWTASAEAVSKRDGIGADVMVLLTDLTDYCGKADGIGVAAGDAYVVVDYDCATGYYSTGHEIGHLYGCRHDTNTDGTLTPYAYGHGWHMASNTWRTIMAYAPGTRINWFSNPNKYYNGYQMGDTTRRNNALVITNRGNTIDAFKEDGCFGADMQVRVQSEEGVISTIPISQLTVGQKVESMNGFSPVITFLDRSDDATPMLTFVTKSGELQLTRNHLIFKADSISASPEAVQAKDVRVGDYLIMSEERVAVEKIESTSSMGAYAPLTLGGTIVVNGVAASCYAEVSHTLAQIFFRTPVVIAHYLGLVEQTSQGVHPMASFFKGMWRASPRFIGEYVLGEKYFTSSS